MRTRVILSVILFVSTLGIAASPAPQAPITAKQLLAWVVGGMSMDHLTAEMASRGLAFRPDPPYLELMKSAGASANLLYLLPRAQMTANAPPPPTADPAFTKLSAVAMALGAKDNDAAGKLLGAAVELEPNNPDLLFALGGIFKKAEDWGNVAEADRRATALAPDFLDAHLAIAYACYRLEDAECAESESKLVLRRLPHDAEAHKDLGLAYMLRNDPQSAVREYREAIRLMPGYANAYYDLGIALHDLHDLDGAIAANQQAIKIDPDSVNQYYNLGVSFADKGDHANAIAAYRKAKQLDPKRLDIRQNLGIQLCASAQFPEATKELKELLAMDWQWNIARPCLGNALLRTGQLDEAIAVYRESLRQDPSDENLTRVGLGSALAGKKEFREAQAQYEQAAHDHPDSAETHYALGVFLFNQIHFEPAAPELEEAVRLDPNNTQYLEELARDYESLEHYDRAQAVEERMMAVLKVQKGENSVEMAEAQNELATNLFMQHKYDQAKAVELQAIKILEQDPTKADDLQTFRNNYQSFLTEESQNNPSAAKAKPGHPQASVGSQSANAPAPGPSPGVGGNPDQADFYVLLHENIHKAQNAQRQNRINEAEQYFVQASLQAEKLPPGDQMQLFVLEQLAGIYADEGRAADAERVMKHTLALAEMGGGPDSPQVADVLGNMATGSRIHHNLPAAQEYAEHALRIREMTPGNADPRLVDAIELLANVYSASKQYAKAEPLYTRALALTVQAHGPDDPSLAMPLDDMASFYANTGQFEKAEEAYRRVIAIEEKAYGPDSPILLGELYALIQVLRNRGRPAEADEVQKRHDAIEAKQKH
jgi:tetratricopeptide (TPR) repeat protein